MMHLRSLFGVVLTTLLACAQTEPAAQNPKRPEQPGALVQTLRVHVLGASVSGGFRDGPLTGATETGDSVSLQHVLKAWCGENARATTHAPLEMMAMFTKPEEIGEKQIQAAVKAKPDSVCALDFPFWFAYGYVAGDDESKLRKERFAKGLELLAQLEMPVVVGDLPDMQGAVRRILNPKQIPSPAVLKELNAQLAAFVAEHKNVRLVALAELVRVMKQDGAKLPLAGGALQTLPGALLQGDKLHPNRLGMAMLGFTLEPAWRELFPKDHPLHAQKWTFEQFVTACGAEDELEAARASAKKGAETNGGK